MTGKLYQQQHKGAFLKTYVLLLKLFSETLVKKKKEEKVCCIISCLTKHSHTSSNKQIKNKVQPSRIKIYNRICFFFFF